MCIFALLLRVFACEYYCIFLCTPSPTVQKDLLRTQEGDEEVRRLAKNITMPVLILWGQHDRVSRGGEGRRGNEEKGGRREQVGGEREGGRYEGRLGRSERIHTIETVQEVAVKNT